MVLRDDQIVHKEEIVKKERKIPKKLLMSIGIGLGAIAIVIILSLFTINTISTVKTKSIDSAFQGYVDLMGNGKYEEAYNQCLSASLKKNLEVKAFKDMSEFYLKKLGPFFEKKIQDRQFVEVKGQSAVDILCTSLYPSGPAIERYLLVKEGGKWKIEGFNLESPALATLSDDKGKEELHKDLPKEVAADLATK